MTLTVPLLEPLPLFVVYTVDPDGEIAIPSGKVVGSVILTVVPAAGSALPAVVVRVISEPAARMATTTRAAIRGFGRHGRAGSRCRIRAPPCTIWSSLSLSTTIPPRLPSFPATTPQRCLFRKQKLPKDSIIVP